MGGRFKIPRTGIGGKSHVDPVIWIGLDALPQAWTDNPIFVVMQGLGQIDAEAPGWKQA